MEAKNYQLFHQLGYNKCWNNMATKIFRRFFFVLMLFTQSCNLSDSTKHLGEGYFYRNEGGNIKDILCEHPTGGEIPATVIDYTYDENFIIAKQKPKLPQDPLYEKEYYYRGGANGEYYWIVIKYSHVVLGPLSDVEYKEMRKKHKIPGKLEFNPKF
ncbi:MAG: DUF3997 domain-containing protein [Flavobacteriaceae bacterium]|nr:DUF3997 domain-containing protein [Flavobacteriaceae bacterium]